MRRTTVGWAQVAWFVGTGLWPILHLRSFEAVTGPKTDHWLVQSFGVLVLVIAAALARGLVLGRPGGTRWIGISSAAALASIDVLYVTAGAIPPIYLGDAAVEGALILGWIAGRGPAPAHLP